MTSHNVQKRDLGLVPGEVVLSVTVNGSTVIVVTNRGRIFKVIT